MSELRFRCEEATTCLLCDNSIEELQERGLTRSDGSCRKDPDACQIIKVKRRKEQEALQNLRGDKLPTREPCCQWFDECENSDDFDLCHDCERNWDNEEYDDYFERKEPEEIKSPTPPVKVVKNQTKLLLSNNTICKGKEAQ